MAEFQVDSDEVRRIARLAHLAVEPDEVPALVDHFNAMLRFVSTLDEVGVEGLAADVGRDGHWAELRPDNVRSYDAPGASLPREAVLERAPESSDEHFLVPRVIG